MDALLIYVDVCTPNRKFIFVEKHTSNHTLNYVDEHIYISIFVHKHTSINSNRTPNYVDAHTPYHTPFYVDAHLHS